ncbi:MAG TPA: S8/S53 family peptidase [Chitinophagaceae bacterium]|nr:S8/S53 family peptidase [Chitinophagaceae bacterium]
MKAKLLLAAYLALFSQVAVAVGDSCSAAIPMPYSPNSVIMGNILPGTIRWFTFIPITPEIKITLTNTTPVGGHIHDLLLMEGLCNPKYFVIGYDRGNDTVLTIVVHDLIVGIPYFIVTMREIVGCPGCIGPAANFDLQVQSLPPPVMSDTNGIIFLNGIASHKKNEVVLRINKLYLKMNAVDNLVQDDMPVPVFVQPAMIQSMANRIMNGNTIGLGQLHLKRVFPNMTSADSISISRLGDTIRIPNFWETFILTIPDTMSVFKTSRGLAGINGIRFAEPNYAISFPSVPNDNFYAGGQGSLHPTIPYPNAHINVESAWDIETGKPFVKIGVFDTGIDQTHSELSGGKVAGGFNFDANAPLSSPYDNNGHGTSCGGIIGAYRNNVTGIAGIAGGDVSIGNSGCSLYDMKIKLSGSNIISISSIAADAIIRGATSVSNGGFGLYIMSNSWAIDANTLGTSIYVIHDAVQFAVKNGVVFCAARGNYPTWAPIDKPMFPSCFQDEMVINVGASGINGEWKTNGNGNPLDAGDNQYESMTKNGVDIIAPGTNAVVYTTETLTNGYSGFNGTSASTPHVAGVAGLMLSHVDQPFPTLTNFAVEDVENILQLSSVDKNAVGYDDYSGWGLMDATGAMNKIKLPAYKVQHFGVAQNTTSYTISQSVVSPDEQVFLPNGYLTLSAGTYFADRVLVTITLNYNLDSPNDQIIGFWPRFSSTIGWTFENPIQTDNWCQIISVTNTQAILRTYIYNFKYDQNGNIITDPWYPTQFNPKAALSIYTFNPTLSGASDLGNDGSTFFAYPNPANNSATISVSILNSQNISLELYDSQGQLVKQIANERVSAGTHQFEFSTEEIAEGVYYYRLIAENSSYGKKLIVIKN